MTASLIIMASFAARPDVLLLWWSAVILLGSRPPSSAGTRRRSRRRVEPGLEMLLWLLAAAGVVLTLISHRPDADDAFYVNVAVAAADAPGRALLSVDTMHGIPGLPLIFRCTACTPTSS